MQGFWALILRDIRLAVSSGGGGGLGVAFFLILATLIPFGVGPLPELLSRIAPGVIWVGALLACLLTLDRLFQADLEDGSLEVMALSPMPMLMIVTAKAAAHWLTSGLPLVITAPLIGIMLRMPIEAQGPMLLSLLIGTPALSFIGTIGAALTAGLRRGGLLTSVLVMPFYIPTLIFGTLIVQGASLGQNVSSPLMMLGAITLASLVIAPLASSMALRLALE